MDYNEDPEPYNRAANEWQEYAEKLGIEIDRLKAKLAKTEKERDDYRRYYDLYYK